MLKRICIYISFLCFCLPSWSQEELGLHFMPGAWQATQTNPAFMMHNKVAVTLPSFGIGLTNSGFSFSDILTEVPGEDSLSLDMDRALQLLDTRNYLRMRGQLDLLQLGLRFGKLQLSLSARTNALAYVDYPSDLLDLVWNGNSAYIGSTLSLEPDIEMMAYQEIALGAAYKLQENLHVGIRLKYFSGLANVSSERSLTSISIDNDYYQTTFETDIVLQTSMLNVDLDNGFSAEFSPRPFTQNSGIGVDLGTFYRLNDQFSFSASLMNLGAQINWKEDVTVLSSKGSYTFEGIEINNIFGEIDMDFESITDSITEVFEFQETGGEYQSKLPTKTLVSATFSPLQSLRLGASMYNESFRGENFQAFTLSASKDLGKIFTGGITYTVRKRSYENLGVNALIKGGPVVFFIYTDNVLSFIVPRSARSTHIRWGLNLAI